MAESIKSKNLEEEEEEEKEVNYREMNCIGYNNDKLSLKVPINNDQLSSLYHKLKRKYWRFHELHRAISIPLLNKITRLETLLIENNEKIMKKWNKQYKGYCESRINRWRLNDENENDEMFLCRMCETKIKLNKHDEHGKDCLEKIMLRDQISQLSLKFLQISKNAFDQKNSFNTKTIIQR